MCATFVRPTIFSHGFALFWPHNIISNNLWSFLSCLATKCITAVCMTVGFFNAEAAKSTHRQLGYSVVRVTKPSGKLAMFPSVDDAPLFIRCGIKLQGDRRIRPWCSSELKATVCVFVLMLINYLSCYSSRYQIACADRWWFPDHVSTSMQILCEERAAKSKPSIDIVKQLLMLIPQFNFQIQTFYKIKASHGSIFEDLRPITVRHVYEQELVKLIPTRDIHGRRALWIEAGSNDTVNCTRTYPTITHISILFCPGLQKDGNHQNVAWTISSAPFKWPFKHRWWSPRHKSVAASLYSILRGSLWPKLCSLHHRLPLWSCNGSRRHCRCVWRQCTLWTIRIYSICCSPFSNHSSGRSCASEWVFR